MATPARQNWLHPRNPDQTKLVTPMGIATNWLHHRNADIHNCVGFLLQLILEIVVYPLANLVASLFDYQASRPSGNLTG